MARARCGDLTCQRIDDLDDKVADLQRQLQQAQEELLATEVRLKALRTYMNLPDDMELPVALGVGDGRGQQFLYGTYEATKVAQEKLIKLGIVKRDAAEQRALAERLVGLLLQTYAEGKCSVAIRRFLHEGNRLSPLGFPGNRATYTLNVLLAEAQEEGDVGRE